MDEGRTEKELKGGSLRDAGRGLDRGRELDGVRMGKKGRSWREELETWKEEGRDL